MTSHNYNRYVRRCERSEMGWDGDGEGVEGGGREKGRRRVFSIKKNVLWPSPPPPYEVWKSIKEGQDDDEFGRRRRFIRCQTWRRKKMVNVNEQCELAISRWLIETFPSIWGEEVRTRRGSQRRDGGEAEGKGRMWEDRWASGDHERNVPLSSLSQHTASREAPPPPMGMVKFYQFFPPHSIKYLYKLDAVSHLSVITSEIIYYLL